MILIIDDDIAVQTSLKLLLKQNSYATDSFSNPKEAAVFLSENHVDCILLDLNFSIETSGKEGIDFLKVIKKKYPKIPVILITAWGTIALAVEGVKHGAFDFISKPWNNNSILKTVQTALDLNEEREPIPNIRKNYDFENIIGNHQSIISILETVAKVAKTNASVLILGESGSGKELIAEAIHQNSHRSKKDFIKVNLGGINQTLFESEMFGHKKGAYTDAKSDRDGRFKMADKGTIFLDEIGDLSLQSQVKLLRVLQEQQFEVLGSSKTEHVDVRVISATNSKLDKMVIDGSFREDLYYRINLIILEIPALRNRISDIPLLVNYFLNNLSEIYNVEEIEVSSEAMTWLKQQSWPGNIRELKNVVDRTFLMMQKSRLELDDFKNQKQKNVKKANLNDLPDVGQMTLEEMEKSMIIKAIEFHKNNMSQVARSLGLTRTSLYRRLEKYTIENS